MIKDEFNKLQKHRWDFKYGLFTTHIIEMSPNELLDDVSVKLNEIVELNVSAKYSCGFSNLLDSCIIVNEI